MGREWQGSPGKMNFLTFGIKYQQHFVRSNHRRCFRASIIHRGGCDHVAGEEQSSPSTSDDRLETLGSGQPWHVLHVRSNAERKVAQVLTLRSIEAYLPLYREKVKWSDRTVVTERPLFAGYVFTRYAPESKLIVISTPGVVRSLGEEEKDLVSCEELDRIREALSSGYPLRPHPQVTAGTRVKVRTGVFEGVEGTVTELRQQCKVIIALGAVRQCFSLEVDLENLTILE